MDESEETKKKKEKKLEELMAALQAAREEVEMEKMKHKEELQQLVKVNNQQKEELEKFKSKQGKKNPKPEWMKKIKTEKVYTDLNEDIEKKPVLREQLIDFYKATELSVALDIHFHANYVVQKGPYKDDSHYADRFFQLIFDIQDILQKEKKSRAKELCVRTHCGTTFTKML